MSPQMPTDITIDERNPAKSSSGLVIANYFFYQCLKLKPINSKCSVIVSDGSVNILRLYGTNSGLFDGQSDVVSLVCKTSIQDTFTV